MIKHTTRFLASGAALGAALLLSDPASAQQGQAPRQGERAEQHDGRGARGKQDRAERRLAQLTERLSLSGDQQVQIRRILQQEREQMQAFRQKQGGQGQRGARPQGERQGEQGARPRGERRQPSPELQALRQRTEQQVEAVLNERQRAEYRELRQELANRQRERGQQRGEQRQGERPAARS